MSMSSINAGPGETAPTNAAGANFDQGPGSQAGIAVNANGGRYYTDDAALAQAAQNLSTKPSSTISNALNLANNVLRDGSDLASQQKLSELEQSKHFDWSVFDCDLSELGLEDPLRPRTYLEQTIDGTQANGNATNASMEPAMSGSIANFTQGQVGDCYFLSAANAIASRPGGDTYLSSLVKPAKDDPSQYEVTFPGDKSHTPIKISKDEVQKYNKNFQDRSGDGTIPILSAAAAKFCNQGLGGYFSGGQAMTLLTGNWSSVTAVHPNTPDGIQSAKDVMKAGQDAKEPITAQVGIVKADGTSHGAHVFSIDSYDEKTNKVTYKNPWDSSKTYQQPLDEFLRQPNCLCNPGEHWGSVEELATLQPLTGYVNPRILR